MFGHATDLWSRILLSRLPDHVQDERHWWSWTRQLEIVISNPDMRCYNSMADHAHLEIASTHVKTTGAVVMTSFHFSRDRRTACSRGSNQLLTNDLLTNK